MGEPKPTNENAACAEVRIILGYKGAIFMQIRLLPSLKTGAGANEARGAITPAKAFFVLPAPFLLAPSLLRCKHE